MSPSEVSPRLRKARAYQRGENAGKISGQERHSGRTALKNHGLNSNHVKSAKNPSILCCYPYRWVMHSTAYMVRHRMKVFVISQKTKLNREKEYCPLWTGHRYRNSWRKDDLPFSLRRTVRHLLFNKQIIPYHEQKRMEEM